MYGYSRPTGDIDIWVRMDKDNAVKIKNALIEFDFQSENINSDYFLIPNNLLRIGFFPLRIEIMTTIDGVEFEECFNNSTIREVDGVDIRVISLDDLKKNKKTSGRFKDLDDLQKLG